MPSQRLRGCQQTDASPAVPTAVVHVSNAWLLPCRTELGMATAEVTKLTAELDEKAKVVEQQEQQLQQAQVHIVTYLCMASVVRYTLCEYTKDVPCQKRRVQTIT